jgi:hypothetical protein
MYHAPPAATKRILPSAEKFHQPASRPSRTFFGNFPTLGTVQRGMSPANQAPKRAAAGASAQTTARRRERSRRAARSWGPCFAPSIRAVAWGLGKEGRKEGEIDVGRAGRARCGEERAEVGAVHAALARMAPQPDLLELGGDPTDESEAPGLNCIDASIPRYWRSGNHQRRASNRRRRQGRRLPPVSGSPSGPIQVCLLRAAWILT